MTDLPRYDLCAAINYYAPYVNGQTETARQLAEGLARRGWQVAMVAARHDPALPAVERLGGVDVYRTPVVGRVGRGLVSPGFASTVRRLGRRSEVVHLHLPMLEAGLVAAPPRPAPLVLTHHIDLWLPPSRVNDLARTVVAGSTRYALVRSAAVVVNSEDQARGSRFWPLADRWEPVPPPCLDRRGGAPAYRDGPGTHVGFLGRLVPDKGIDQLLTAFAGLPDTARLLIAGDFLGYPGDNLMHRVRAAAAADPRIRVLGMLAGREIDDFYASIDVFALPSVAESFGIAQTEAMMCGVPSVTTDLPGGRWPVAATGFGVLVPPGDPAALRAALVRAAAFDPARRAAGAARTHDLFALDRSLDRYEALLRTAMGTAGVPVAR